VTVRAIVNMMSGTVAKAAGWRAREIHVDEPVVTVEDVFRAVVLADGDGTLYDLIREAEGLKPEFALYVGGELLRGTFDWRRAITDSEQIHVADWPMNDF
jgi:hypothetical protein